MKKPEKRPYHHGDLRAALLRAGERALQEGGTESFSLRDLSREVGVSNYAPRRHFASKQAFLEALALNGFEQLGIVLDRSVAKKEQTFDVSIRKLARAYIQFATGNKALIRLMFAAKHHKDAPTALLEANRRAWKAGPATILGGQAAGAVVAGDPKRLSLVLFSALEGLISIYTEQEFGDFTLESLAEEVVGTILLGLRSRPYQLV